MGMPSYFKENPIMLSDSYVEYENFYKEYDISANFNPMLWIIDLHLINYLSKYATHVSILFRNPYDFIERYYDFVGHDQNTSDFTEFCINSNYANYEKICKRWVGELKSDTKFKIFYFDHLVEKPTEFLSEYFEFVGLEHISTDLNKIQKHESKKSVRTTIDFSKSHKKIINSYIDNFSDYAKVNLSHWKK
jgi:hypothetical protein